MKKVALVFSSDYELFGDGSGNVSREQILLTDNLTSILSEYGAKLTVMFEYAQYIAYEKFSSVNPHFSEDNKNIREQLIKLNSFTVDIYGPLLQGHYNKQNFENKKVTYKGALPSDRVLSTLNKYDVVLLPSYKEGYPGIVIEAYSLGMPVITTNLPSISEIVDDYETGILINPRNITELRNAIEYFDEANYKIMSKKSYKKFDNFKSDLIIKEFINLIHE